MEPDLKKKKRFSYVCSDLIQARRVPGVNLSKIQGLNDPRVIQESTRNAFYEEPGVSFSSFLSPAGL